jgi:hypothetical protein
MKRNYSSVSEKRKGSRENEVQVVTFIETCSLCSRCVTKEGKQFLAATASEVAKTNEVETPDPQLYTNGVTD